jgi:hypothetical protein
MAVGAQVVGNAFAAHLREGDRGPAIAVLGKGIGAAGWPFSTDSSEKALTLSPVQHHTVIP